MEEIKIYVVGPATYYASWIKNHTLVDNIEDADIVMFTGGEDVDPSIYGKDKHFATASNLNRDLAEKAEFEKIKPNQLALGICRGSQFLCALNGGILVQDCSGHARFGTHPITDGKTVMEITSTHHQMQYPFTIYPDDYEILWWSEHRLSRHYDAVPSSLYVEPEIVYYHVKGKPTSLAIQGHPEMMSEKSPTIDVLNKLVETCLQKIK